MRNPELTKEKILKVSGELFNTHGYKATSISQITEATGFTKGAIYKHFVNKEELEKETFLYLSRLVSETLGRLIRAEKNAIDKLEVIFTFFESYLKKPPVVGGCPLLNMAVESDDAHPELRIEAYRLLELLRRALVTILENGIRHGQLDPETDVRQYSSVILASLEGAIMMGKLAGTSDDMQRVVKHLRVMVRQIKV